MLLEQDYSLSLLTHNLYNFLFLFRSTNGLCPIDQEPISLNEIFRDKRKSLEINDLQCFCNNKQYGCLWKDTVGNIEVIPNIQTNIKLLQMQIAWSTSSLAHNRYSNK